MTTMTTTANTSWELELELVNWVPRLDQQQLLLLADYFRDSKGFLAPQ